MAARPLSEVSVGDVVGPVTVPVTRETLVAYANASGDQNPIHQDESFARSVGLPDVIAHGMWTMGASGTVVADWAGDAGRVVEFGTRFTKPVVVPVAGTELVVQGVVKAVDAETGRVTVDVTTTCGGEKVLGRCVAVVRLELMRELHDEPIAAHTTMRVGGPAARMVVAETADELVDAVREVDDAQEPLLVLGGGSNLVVADAGFEGTVVKVGDARRGRRLAGPVRRGERRRRRGGGLGRPGRACRRGGVVGDRGAVRHPGVDRSDAGAERRGVRAGGRADHRAGAGVGPHRAAGAHDDLGRLPVHLPPLGVQGLGPLRRARRHVPARAGHDVAAGAVRRPRARTSGSRWARGCRWATPGRRCWPSAGAAGWCSTRPTTTRGAVGRSSRTRSCRRTTSRRWSARVAQQLGVGAPVHRRGFRAADGRVKTSAAWLIERAGFGKGFGMPGPAALSTKHTLAVTNRGDGDGIRRRGAGPARCGTASPTPSASRWSTSRSSSGTYALSPGGAAARRSRHGRGSRGERAGVLRGVPVRWDGARAATTRRTTTTVGAARDLLGDVVGREATAAAAHPGDELGARPEGRVDRAGGRAASARGRTVGTARRLPAGGRRVGRCCGAVVRRGRGRRAGAAVRRGSAALPCRRRPGSCAVGGRWQRQSTNGVPSRAATTSPSFMAPAALSSRITVAWVRPRWAA